MKCDKLSDNDKNKMRMWNIRPWTCIDPWEKSLSRMQESLIPQYLSELL